MKSLIPLVLPEATYKPRDPLFSRIFAQTIFEDYLSQATDLQHAQNDKTQAITRTQ
jgi:hypothetical protein